jgi:hypothetical protein
MARSFEAFEYTKLEAFTFHVLRDPRVIKRQLMKWITMEWEHDHALAPDEYWTVEWLERLPKMKFSLEILKLSDIRPRPDLMAHSRPGYSFVAELEERVKERAEAVGRGCSVEPLLVDGSHDMELMDGYVRYTLLRRHHQRAAYVYVGMMRQPQRTKARQ